MIRAGQVLKVPSRTSGAVTKVIKTAEVKPKSEFAQVHVVRRGETLIEIARKYDVSLGRIASSNSLKSRSIIHVGKRLVIPQ